MLGERPELGLRPIGVLDDPAVTPDRFGCLGRPADLPDVVARHGVTRVIVAFPAALDPEPGTPGGGPGGLTESLRRARELGARVWVVPRFAELGMTVPLGRLDDVWGVPVVALRAPSRAAALGRRVADVVGAAVLLVSPPRSWPSRPP